MSESYLRPLGRSMTCQISELMAARDDEGEKVHKNPGNSPEHQNKLIIAIHSHSALLC